MSRATNPVVRSRAVLGWLPGLGVLVLAGAIVSGYAGQAAAMAEATSQATRAAGSPNDATQGAAAIDAFEFDFYKSDLTSGGNAVVSPTSIVWSLDSLLYDRSSRRLGGPVGVKNPDSIMRRVRGIRV